MKRSLPWWGASRTDLAQPHNWLIFSIIEPALSARLVRHARGRLLDIGCGTKPFRHLATAVESYVGVDTARRSQTTGPDVLATAYDLPFVDGSFQTVLCTDVLEHLEDPAAAVREAARVLESGGMAIYTVPLFWHVHEAPRDFYRFTRYGLQHLFEAAGMEVVEIEALTGFTAMAAQELAYFLHGLHPSSRRNPIWRLVPPLLHGLQAAALAANKIERTERFTAEYILVARKPSPASSSGAGE